MTNATRRLVLAMAVLSLMTGAAGRAEAGLIIGSSSGVFANPSSSGTVVGLGTNSVDIGQGTPSKLSFNGTSFDIDPFQDVVFGQITLFNGLTVPATNPDTIDLNLALNLTAPERVSTGTTVTLSLLLTPNVGTPEEQADGLTFSTTPSAILFTAGGFGYRFQFTKLDAITGNGFAVASNDFRVYEGQTASVQLPGRFTQEAVSVVPEPSTLVSASIAGLMGLGYFWRRRKAKLVA
jgi:PEP-CTERM motif